MTSSIQRQTCLRHVRVYVLVRCNHILGFSLVNYAVRRPDPIQSALGNLCFSFMRKMTSKIRFQENTASFPAATWKNFLNINWNKGHFRDFFLMGWHSGLVGCGSHRNSENPIRNNLSLVSTFFFSGNFSVSTPAKSRCSPIVVFLFRCGGKVNALQFRQQQIQLHFLLPLLRFFLIIIII